ncbi:zinc finger protein 711-like [Coccinella septempunctata]|uniref:zinc finger protein 711-like n=1 Tax=Coccinella septempunctata TaxID=41139 RepID=UPI001D08155E|nr:zinc finger protein 711-like [Coccinella septempunctata]
MELFNSKNDGVKNVKEILDMDIIEKVEDTKKEICIEEINFTHQVFGDLNPLDHKINDAIPRSNEDLLDKSSKTEEKPIPIIFISIGDQFETIGSKEKQQGVSQKPKKRSLLCCHLCEYSAFRYASKKPFVNLSDIPRVRFKSRSKVKEHMTQAHPNFKMRKCYFCGYETLYKSSLDRHIDGIHLNLRNHKCHLCDFSSTRKYDLKRHVDNVHLNLRIHKCLLCKFRSNRKYGLKKHLETVHSYYYEELVGDEMENIELYDPNHPRECKLETTTLPDDPQGLSKCYRCHLCDYSSNRESNVERHIFFVHLNMRKKKKPIQRVHECRFCDFNTNDRASLRKHIIGVHLNLRNHKCHLCEYTSNHRSTLKTHINTVHLNLRRHKCSVCEYSSNHKKVLRAHFKSKHYVKKKRE